MRFGPGCFALLLALLHARLALAAEVRVLEVSGEVELSPGGDDSRAFPLKGGETVRESDRLVTGMESQARLQFADNSLVVVGELTDMKVALFKDGGGAVQTRLWLRGGEISADVNRSVERPSDFTVKTPTATAGVKGTRKRVFSALDRTQVSILSGRGYGVDASGTTHEVGAGERSETDEEGHLQAPDRVTRDESRVDGTSGDLAYDEAESLEESALFTPLTPGTNNAGGVSSQQDVITDLVQSTDRNAGGAVLGPNILQDSGFDASASGQGPWITNDPSVFANSAVIGAVTRGSNFTVEQGFVFPSAGSYLFSADIFLNVAPGNTSGVDLGFILAGPGATFSGGTDRVIFHYDAGASVNQTFTETITATDPTVNIIQLGVQSSGGSIGSDANFKFDNVTINGPN